MGPSGAGKSTYIKKNFPDADVIDLYECQQKYFRKGISTYNEYISNIIASYDDCLDLMVKAICKHIGKGGDGKDVVLEHTLMKDFRRYQYLDAARKAGADRIKAICILPSKDQYYKNIKSRWKSLDVDGMIDMLDEFEMPVVSEDGFDEVEVITV